MASKKQKAVRRKFSRAVKKCGSKSKSEKKKCFKKYFK